MLHALAVVFALLAIACMLVAIAGMVTGRPGPRAGGLIRALALACFATAVVLNIAAH